MKLQTFKIEAIVENDVLGRDLMRQVMGGNDDGPETCQNVVCKSVSCEQVECTTKKFDCGDFTCTPFVCTGYKLCPSITSCAPITAP